MRINLQKAHHALNSKNQQNLLKFYDGYRSSRKYVKVPIATLVMLLIVWYILYTGPMIAGVVGLQGLAHFWVQTGISFTQFSVMGYSMKLFSKLWYDHSTYLQILSRTNIGIDKQVRKVVDAFSWSSMTVAGINSLIKMLCKLAVQSLMSQFKWVMQTVEIATDMVYYGSEKVVDAIIKSLVYCTRTGDHAISMFIASPDGTDGDCKAIREHLDDYITSIEMYIVNGTRCVMENTLHTKQINHSEYTLVINAGSEYSLVRPGVYLVDGLSVGINCDESTDTKKTLDILVDLRGVKKVGDEQLFIKIADDIFINKDRVKLLSNIEGVLSIGNIPTK